LRWDNADLRLIDYGREAGLVSDRAYGEFESYRLRVESLLSEDGRLGSPMEPLGLSEWDTAAFDIEKGPWSETHVEYQAWVQHKYSGYMDRQLAEIARFRSLESKKIPENFDFTLTPGLLQESREKLSKVRPRSLGQASRISGLTPADISILMIYIKRLQASSPGPEGALSMSS
jgi:tRNA uridine 5-carboxymethylaminomethyl modification enzyme